MKLGAVLAVISGLGLLAGYPAKALTNWIFGLKFALLISAALLVRLMARRFFPLAAESRPLPRRAWIALSTLLLFIGGVACGSCCSTPTAILLTSDVAYNQ